MPSVGGGDAARAEELVRAAVEDGDALTPRGRDLLTQQVVVEDHEVRLGGARLGRRVGDEPVDVDVRVTQDVSHVEVADERDAWVGRGEQGEAADRAGAAVGDVPAT